jgi:hypothetical protein
LNVGQPAAGSMIANASPAPSTRQSAAPLGPAALWTRSPAAAVAATGRPGTGSGVPGVGTGIGTGLALPTAMKSRLAP